MTSVVLVAKGDRGVAERIAEPLRAAGYAVMGPYHDAAAALRAIDGRRPDAAILGVRLLVGSGMDVAQRLTALRVPYVLVSPDGRALVPGGVACDVLSAIHVVLRDVDAEIAAAIARAQAALEHP